MSSRKLREREGGEDFDFDLEDLEVVELLDVVVVLLFSPKTSSNSSTSPFVSSSTSCDERSESHED